METDIGEVLLPTESWDVTAYLPEGREQRNHNVTLILQCYFHYLKFIKGGGYVDVKGTVGANNLLK